MNATVSTTYRRRNSRPKRPMIRHKIEKQRVRAPLSARNRFDRSSSPGANR